MAMTDERPEPQIYLATPKLSDAGAFAPVLEATLAAVSVACVLVDVDPAKAGDAKKILRDLTPLIQRNGAAALSRDATQAARVGGDGVHARVDDQGFPRSLEDAIASLKPERIVGLGGLRARHEAMAAGEQGVDYVMFGDPTAEGAPPPLSETLELVSWWSEIFTVPCVAWAAEPAQAGALIAAGADFIAFGPAVWGDPRGPVRAMLEAMNPVAEADSQ